ncbi:sex peptide receptor-like [Babylonia areolata]|uniref:sex peptide receptor-like n=1 Tax=Babylonia areolata TaxID=304850 RepID=UPI003FD0B4DA
MSWFNVTTVMNIGSDVFSPIKSNPTRISKAIDFWVPPLVFFTGTLTNTLVIMVMRSKHFRHMSTSFYMAVSALVDIISLLVPIPPHYLYVNFPHIFDSVRHVHVICSISHASGWMTSNLGVFLTVAMTIDRSLAIQFPLKAPTLCTVKKAKIVTVCLLVLVFLMDGHVAFTTRVVPKGVKAYLCAIDKSFSDVYRIFHDQYWPNIHNVFLMLSFTALIIGNIIIILHVKRSEDSKDLGEGAKSSGGTQSKEASSKSRQLSLMLVIDSASMIICTLPHTISMMVDQSHQSTQLSDNSPYDIAKHALVFATGFYLIQVNHCTNFFLYCLSGARFRKALKEVMCGKRQQNTRNSSRPPTSDTSAQPRSRLKE